MSAGKVNRASSASRASGLRQDLGTTADLAEKMTIDQVDSLQAMLEQAWGLAVAVHGQVNGAVKSPIDRIYQQAAMEQVLALLLRAEEVAGDMFAHVETSRDIAACTARLINNWYQNEHEMGAGQRLANKPLGACIWFLVDQLEAAIAAVKADEEEVDHA